MRPGSDALVERVAAIAAELTGVRVEDPAAPLDLSPLARTEFALALEKAFGVRLDDSRRLRTVAEAAATVSGRGGERGLEPSLDPATGQFQGVARAIVGSVLRRYFRLVVRGAERVPRSGPVVLAANHDSMWDSPVLAVASPRPIVFMAEEGLFGSATASWFFTRLGGFPVRRGGGDLRAIRAALSVVNSGRVLGIYPEGTRRPGALLRFRLGAAWIALASGALLVPAGIAGTGHIVSGRISIPRRAHLQITFGEPITVVKEPKAGKRLDQASDLTDRLRSEVERLIHR
ncbi:MAG TPA: 1-acyl-sn-glycerol-3-phosphate acyltransferase [Actinomycetota bacterium]|nr:1-acyl-sn-glycerol-3-phosphate acyltransferase [Actinomycetota bacterium]